MLCLLAHPPQTAAALPAGAAAAGAAAAAAAATALPADPLALLAAVPDANLTLLGIVAANVIGIGAVARLVSLAGDRECPWGRALPSWRSMRGVGGAIMPRLPPYPPPMTLAVQLRPAAAQQRRQHHLEPDALAAVLAFALPVAWTVPS